LLIFERKIFRRICGPKYEDGEWKMRMNQELEELNKGEYIVKWIKGQRISWLGHLERMEEDRMPKKDFHSRTVRDKTKRKTQEKMERSGKRSSSVGSEKMERVGDRWGQMERYCSTGQSPQRAVAPKEGGGGGYNFELKSRKGYVSIVLNFWLLLGTTEKTHLY
jgi:hypothetical protein